MKRNFQAFLLAMMAVGAMSAIGSSAAQATEFDCTANCTVSTEKDGTGTTAHHVFDAPGNGPITCTEGKFSATGQPAESTSLKVSPAYTGCEFLGQTNAFVDANECHYVFNAHGGVQVECTNGTLIEFGIPGCVGTVGNQSLTGITDSGEPGQTVTVGASVTGIHVLMEGPACITEGTFGTGRYTTGNTIVTGATAGGEMVNVDWDTATSD